MKPISSKLVDNKKATVNKAYNKYKDFIWWIECTSINDVTIY